MIDFADDLDPTSEIRAVTRTARRLVVDTGLRGVAAESAWVTVTDEVGAVYFEGPPSADGCIDVSFEGAPTVAIARVTLETPTGHRQAHVELGTSWTAHAFS
jgi:hypothetical protein